MNQDGGGPAGDEADVGDPSSPTGHIVLEVTAGNAVGTVIDVDDELLIGRVADGVGRLAEDMEISRRHARIFRAQGGRYAVEDLISTNGTYVNGRRVGEVTLLDVGDWLDVGTTTLVVRIAPPDLELQIAPRDEAQAGREPAAQGPLMLRLEIDLAGSAVRIYLGEDSDPVTVVNRDGRWRAELGD